MDRISFVFYKDWKEAIKDLPSDVRLEIYDGITEYAFSGNIPMLKPLASIAFNFVKAAMDRDFESYNKRVEASRENGKKGAEFGKLGGRPRKETPKTPKGDIKTPKTPDNDNDNDNENDFIPLTPFEHNFNFDFCDDKWKELLLKWAEWRAVNIKRPLIQRQVEAAYSLLNHGKSFEDAKKIVEMSIVSGWDNLYPERIIHQKQVQNERAKKKIVVV